jgi:hypothetical protein
LSQPAVVYFFQAGVLFSIENATFLPISASFGYFGYFGVLFTGINRAAVYQN